MRTVEPRPQLLTYPDSLGGDLRALVDLLDGPLDGLFDGVHVLPPFPSSGDRGFAPLTYDTIDPRFGTWADIGRIAERHDVLLDLMINHISRESREFQDFLRRGRASASRRSVHHARQGLADGPPADADVARIFLRKPEPPFTTVTIEDSGRQDGLDLFRDGRLVRADRPRRHRSGDSHSDHGLAATVRRAWGPHRQARRRRLRDQEARDVVLHGRARDLRLSHG